VNDLLNLIALIIAAAGVAFVGRRVLGVPVGWPRSIIVGMIMISSLSPILPLVADSVGVAETSTATPDILLDVVVLLLILAWTFFLGIALLVVLELIIPTGTLGTPLTWVRTFRERNRRSRRYLQVLTIATRNGLGGFLGRSSRASAHTAGTSLTAQALRKALNDGGVTFIKIGQMLSTRPDLIGPEFAAELSGLQTSSTPSDWATMEAALTASLGRPATEAFAEIDREPMAVASVAQVHAAQLHTGEAVVLKIQKPGARQQVTADLDIVGRLARRLERSTVWARSLGVVALADGFSSALREELDYRIEAENTAAIQASTDADSGLRIPLVYREFSSSTVLVLERLDGNPLGAASEQLAAMDLADRRALADQLLRAVLHQVMVGGVFHADLHPGNVILQPAGQLGMFDFGAVGRLDDQARDAVTTLLLAIDRGSGVSATDALIDLVDPPAAPVDERRLERDVGQLLIRFRGGTQNTAGMFAALFGLVTRYGFGVPTQIAWLFRTLASLEGTLRLIDPEFDLVQAARRQGTSLMDASPESLRDQLTADLFSLLPTLRRLPRRLNKITADFQQGRTTLNVRMLGDPGDRSFLLNLTQQVIIAVLASAATISAIILLTATGGPQLSPTIGLYTIYGYCLLFVGCVLALRALILIFRRSWSL
jgi:ubiquinone biosynthesis protein